MSTTTYTETIEAKRERRAAWAYGELPEEQASLAWR